MIWHLSLLTSNYLEYELVTKVSINYEHLDFPSVTVCNQNPFLNSLIFSPNYEVPAAFREFVNSLEDTNNYDNNQTDPGNRLNHTRSKRSVSRLQVTKPPFQANSSKDLEQSDTYDPESQEEYGYGNASVEFRNFETYSKAIRLLEIDLRRKLGHQKNVFILDCSFNGLECFSK